MDDYTKRIKETLKNTADGLLLENFTLCYSRQYSHSWTCESGYVSVAAVDARAEDLRKHDENLATTFFPMNANTPYAVQELYIRTKLSPTVIMKPAKKD